MPNRRRSPEEWRHLIEQQQISGLSVAEFCIAHDLCSTAFYGWRKRSKDVVSSEGPQFVRLEPSRTVESSRSWMAVTTPQGFRLECSGSIDPQMITKLLSALDRNCSGC